MTQPSSSRPQLADHFFVVAAWVIACLVLFSNLGAAPLTDLDEGAFSEATREMMTRGDWISPWLLDAPRFDKPVLIHWLQMAAFSLTGVSSYGARLPSALMGLVWIGGIGGWAYLIARRVAPAVSVQAYGWAILMSATCLGIPAMSRAATADATLNAFLVLSLLFVWRALWPEKESETGRLWIRLAAVSVGLGLLTKGPIAVLVPGAASLLAVLTCNGLRRWFKLAFDPVAWLIALVIAAPWYLLQFQAQGMAFLEGFLGLHNLGRFASTMHGFSAGPLYYPAWILVASLPWTVPVLGGLFAAMGSGQTARVLRSVELRLAWIVFVFVLVFFSFSATKLPHYGFYGISGLIVITSLAMTNAPPVALRVLALSTPVILCLGATLVSWTPQTVLSYVDRVDDLYFQVVIGAGLNLLQEKSILQAALSSMALTGLVVGVRHFRIGMMLASATIAIAIQTVVVPSLMTAMRGPIYEIAEILRFNEKAVSSAAALDQSGRVITWGISSPSLSFHSGFVIHALEPLPGDWVVLPTHRIRELEKKIGVSSRSIFEKTGIALVRLETERREDTLISDEVSGRK